MQAITDGKDAVIYTDADNSVHLGQIGLLLRPFLQKSARVVLGNRKHPDAVLVTSGISATDRIITSRITTPVPRMLLRTRPSSDAAMQAEAQGAPSP